MMYSFLPQRYLFVGARCRSHRANLTRVAVVDCLPYLLAPRSRDRLMSEGGSLPPSGSGGGVMYLTAICQCLPYPW